MIGFAFQTLAIAPRMHREELYSRNPRMRTITGGLVNASCAGLHCAKVQVEDIPPTRAMAP
jgi:hypothetical protein